MKVYSVIQHLDWCCPGMLVAVDETNEILWVQPNPGNELTRIYADDFHVEGLKFNASDYKEVRLVEDF